MPVSTLMMSVMPSGSGAFDHVAPQIVAFFDSVGHVKVGRAAAQFDGGFEDDDGGGAIDIVVAVDQDAFLALNRRLEAIDGGFHAHTLNKVSEDGRETE